MNDRFKFRVWNKEEKQMYYDAENTYDYMRGNPIIFAESFGCLLTDDDWVVEQCTGLKDKNGNLIYEGDIVIKTDYNALGYTRVRKCNIYWDEKCCLWAIMTEYGDGYPLSDFESQQYEIIGNIHEQEEQQ